MDYGKARMLTETECIIKLFNTLYGNISTGSDFDCITANRPLPCSNCLPRSSAQLTFASSPLPLDSPPLPPFSASAPSPTLVTKPKKPTLTRKMCTQLEAALLGFRNTVRLHEKDHDPHGYIPRTSYFPHPLIQTILNHLTSIQTTEDLQNLLPSWGFHTEHGRSLLALLVAMQTTFSTQRDTARLLRNEKSRIRALAKRQAAETPVSDLAESIIEADTLIDVIIPSSEADVSRDGETSKRGQKRPALTTTSNKPAKRTARAPLASAAAVSETFGPQYQTRNRASARRTEIRDENGQTTLRKLSRR